MNKEKFPQNLEEDGVKEYDSRSDTQDESGRITSPERAREMAEIEDPHHEKTLGIFPPSKDKISKGEEAAAEHFLEKEGLPPAIIEIVKKYATEHATTGPYKEGPLLERTGPGPGIFVYGFYKKFKNPDGTITYQIHGTKDLFERDAGSIKPGGKMKLVDKEPIIITVYLDKNNSVERTEVTERS